MPLIRLLVLFIIPLSLTGCFATAVVGTTAVASSAHDERSLGQQFDDIAIASKIDARLIAEKNMPSRWVSVEVIHGHVTLTGYLPSKSHIDRAVYIIKRMDNVVSVSSKLKIGEPKIKEIASDSWITTNVKRKLLNDKIVSGFNIHVETVNGKVYLQGTVKNAAERQRAKDIARGTDGVTAVVDLIKSGDS
ncbi:MAG: BON domain-containing protein [Mariprofundus sp.]